MCLDRCYSLTLFLEYFLSVIAREVVISESHSSTTIYIKQQLEIRSLYNYLFINEIILLLFQSIIINITVKTLFLSFKN